MKLNRVLGSVLAAAIMLGSFGAGESHAQRADFQKLVAERAPALVSIKFILKQEGEQQEQETTGVLIEAGGLVLTSNYAFGGQAALFGMPSPTPTDLKVMVGDDVQGVDAKIVARDTELGLAWVQVSTPPEKPYAFVDFAAGGEPKLGDSVYLISLMGKFFDRAPTVAEAHLGAIVTKPRKLYMPSSGLRGDNLGLPVFDASGKIIGVSTFIFPDREEMDAPGGFESVLRGVEGGMILPAKEVAEATARAKETAAAGGAEEAPADAPAADKPADAPAAEPK